MERKHCMVQILIGFSMLFLACASSAAGADQQNELLLGQPFETQEILSSNPDADTSISLIKGARYSIAVVITEPLFDLSIPVKNTDGFRTRDVSNIFSRLVLWIASSKKRVRDANWFYLIGYINNDQQDHHIKIGSGGEFVAQHSGRLYTFLNDHPKYYHNNQGSYRIQITKLE